MAKFLGTAASLANIPTIVPAFSYKTGGAILPNGYGSAYAIYLTNDTNIGFSYCYQISCFKIEGDTLIFNNPDTNFYISDDSESISSFSINKINIFKTTKGYIFDIDITYNTSETTGTNCIMEICLNVTTKTAAIFKIYTDNIFKYDSAFSLRYMGKTESSVYKTSDSATTSLCNPSSNSVTSVPTLKEVIGSDDSHTYIYYKSSGTCLHSTIKAGGKTYFTSIIAGVEDN